jgi:hypothetical protein
MKPAPDVARLLALAAWMRRQKSIDSLDLRRDSAVHWAHHNGLAQHYAAHCPDEATSSQLEDDEVAVLFLHGGGLMYYDVDVFRPLLGYCPIRALRKPAPPTSFSTCTPRSMPS